MNSGAVTPRWPSGAGPGSEDPPQKRDNDDRENTVLNEANVRILSPPRPPPHESEDSELMAAFREFRVFRVVGRRKAPQDLGGRVDCGRRAGKVGGGGRDWGTGGKQIFLYRLPLDL